MLLAGTLALAGWRRREKKSERLSPTSKITASTTTSPSGRTQCGAAGQREPNSSRHWASSW